MSTTNKALQFQQLRDESIRTFAARVCGKAEKLSFNAKYECGEVP